MVLYGLVRVRDLVTLGEAARAMALRFPVIPMRFIKLFSIAGMRIERSLRSFLLITDFCIARVRSCLSRTACGRTFEPEPVGAVGTCSPVACRRIGRPPSVMALGASSGSLLDDIVYAEDDGS